MLVQHGGGPAFERGRHFSFAIAAALEACKPA
jgi:hypothetical protein